MKLHFHKSFWETNCRNEDDLISLTRQVHKEGYHGTELFLPFYPLSPELTLNVHERLGLDIIVGVATQGDTPTEHLKSYKDQLDYARKFSPKLINSHTGRDIFSLEENLALYDLASEFQSKYGITIVHETHRFRPTFSTLSTETILQSRIKLPLNLDVSHWMVVHESDLSDQVERVNSILNNVHHIHARVGYEEGPQITDPSDPIWKAHLENHTRIWQQVINNAKRNNQPSFSITPEFGPFPYAHTMPKTQSHLTDIWQANLYMKNYLQNNLTL
ncbi:sugar phosphate isomerase/epimerase [Marinomonas algicola]|uniref:sugar phosphate isomerase/epimerase n=1 Tax=Marinomonas algicola TaxID=2773454 RepID=UPI0017497C21|nr:sugar phosphate isomerase/epimerase [Marinomonas algicola]